MIAFALQFAVPRIIAGELNAQVYTPEVGIILQEYYGAWDEAVSKRVATACPDNPELQWQRCAERRLKMGINAQKSEPKDESRHSRRGLFRDELPKHIVTHDDFYIDKYLVGNAEFRRFTDAELA
jgi:formylglycine-generating enzyme required for sulfatase activity